MNPEHWKRKSWQYNVSVAWQWFTGCALRLSLFKSWHVYTHVNDWRIGFHVQAAGWSLLTDPCRSQGLYYNMYIQNHAYAVCKRSTFSFCLYFDVAAVHSETFVPPVICLRRDCQNAWWWPLICLILPFGKTRLPLSVYHIYPSGALQDSKLSMYNQPQ